MLVDEQWVCDVLADDSLVSVFRDVRQLLNNVDALALRTLRGFVDPEVVFSFAEDISFLLHLFYSCLRLCEPRQEGLVVVWVVVRFRYEVKG